MKTTASVLSPAAPPRPLTGLRLLVVIASHGTKNLGYLRQVIGLYRQMPLEADIVVLSNAPKPDLGPGVEVVVGLPSRNPWSLPFGHKQIFDERTEEYDLFIYSEDDMAITEANLQAFWRVTPLLGSDEVAGFLRYEVNARGERSFPELHGSYHWKVGSVRTRQTVTVAEFSNEHAACFVLTRAQLRRVIASRGFLRAPYEGEYDMLCTAATDPYTQCGLRKVICISELDDFLVHHLPNRYAGHLGLSAAQLDQQVRILGQIAAGRTPPTTLGLASPRALHRRWAKRYDEPAELGLAEWLTPQTRRVLSIGSGWGETERFLTDRGVAVTVIPLDAVMGGVALQQGLTVVPGTLPEALQTLNGTKFDGIVAPNLAHLLSDTNALISGCARLLAHGGWLWLSGPNFENWTNQCRLRWRPWQYQEISRVGPNTLERSLWCAGLSTRKVRWLDPAGQPVWGGRWRASRWSLCASWPLES